MGCKGCAKTRRFQLQQKAMGTVADSSIVQIPADAAAHFSDAIRSARAAMLTLEPWLETQSKPTQQVVGRLFEWAKRWISLAEPLVVKSEDL